MNPTVRSWPSWLCVLLPWIFLGTLAAAMVHLRLGLGHWPKPMIEDYTAMPFRIHIFATQWLGLSSAVVAPPAWAFLVCFRSMRLGFRIHRIQGIVFLSAWAVFALFVWADPWRLVTWAID